MSGSSDLRPYVSAGFPRNLFGLITLAIIIGLVLISAPAIGVAGLDTGGYLSVLVRDLGIAVFVSGFLAATFDLSFRRRTARETAEAIKTVGERTAATTSVAIAELRDAMNRSVEELKKESEIIHLKRQMGEQMFNEILRYLERPTLRKNHVISIRLERTEADKVTACCISEYEVENISELDTQYDVEAYLEDDRPGPKPQITSMKIARPDCLAEVFDRDRIQSMLVPWLHGKQIAYPINLRPRGSAKVEVEYEFTCPVPWRFPWMIPTPQDGIKLTIAHPAELEVDAWVSHPRPEDWKEQPRRKGSDGVITQQWIMHGVFLPYQSVQLSWDTIREISS